MREFDEDDELNERDEEAKRRVSGPATALIIVSAISIGVLSLATCFDLFLLLSGIAARMDDPQGISEETITRIRMAWSLVMISAGIFIVIGALRMRKLRSYVFSTSACIVALVPCIGPCFVLGIPFAIWGLIALNSAQGSFKD